MYVQMYVHSLYPVSIEYAISPHTTAQIVVGDAVRTLVYLYQHTYRVDMYFSSERNMRSQTLAKSHLSTI